MITQKMNNPFKNTQSIQKIKKRSLKRLIMSCIVCAMCLLILIYTIYSIISMVSTLLSSGYYTVIKDKLDHLRFLAGSSNYIYSLAEALYVFAGIIFWLVFVFEILLSILLTIGTVKSLRYIFYYFQD